MITKITCDIEVYPRLRNEEYLKNETIRQGGAFMNVFLGEEYLFKRDGVLVGWYFLKSSTSDCAIGMKNYSSLHTIF